MPGWDFPGGPMGKNPPSNEADVGLIPGIMQGTKIPHARRQEWACVPQPQWSVTHEVTKVFRAAAGNQCSQINKFLKKNKIDARLQEAHVVKKEPWRSTLPTQLGHRGDKNLSQRPFWSKLESNRTENLKSCHVKWARHDQPERSEWSRVTSHPSVCPPAVLVGILVGRHPYSSGLTGWAIHYPFPK